MKFWMVCLILAFFSPAALSRTPPQTGKPAKRFSPAKRDPVFLLTSELAFEGRVVRRAIRQSEIASLLARRVELGGQNSDYGKYGIGYIYERWRFPAFSCQEWAQGRVLGLNGSFNTYERTMESFYISTCSFLFALRDAKPAKQSFIAKPRVGLSNFDLLPVNALDMDEAENDQLTVRSVRISDLIAKRKVKVKSKTENIVVLDYDFDPQTSVPSGETNLEEIGRADFDGDGIEDIFISSADYALQGTGRYYNYFLLTRRSPTAGFEVRKLELPALKENPAASVPEIKLKSSELKRAHLTKQAYGTAWPFNVDEGTLACARAGSVAIFFIAKRQTYSLNVWARGAKIDGVAVSTDTQDVMSSESMSAIFDKAFAMCPIQ